MTSAHVQLFSKDAQRFPSRASLSIADKCSQLEDLADRLIEPNHEQHLVLVVAILEGHSSTIFYLYIASPGSSQADRVMTLGRKGFTPRS